MVLCEEYTFLSHFLSIDSEVTVLCVQVSYKNTWGSQLIKVDIGKIIW